MNHQIYKFSPISNTEEFNHALVYVSTELIRMSEELLDIRLVPNTLKIFAHYFDEYEFLLKHVSSLGEKAAFSSGTSYYSKVNKVIQGAQIDYIGIRKVDPYRLHVGCGDFEVEDLNKFKQVYLGKSRYIREFSEELVEIWHPDFDVLGYVIENVN